MCVVWVVFVFSVFVLFDLFGLKECCNVPTTRAMMSRHLHVRERAKQGRLHSNNYDSTTIYKARTEDRTKTDVPVPGTRYRCIVVLLRHEGFARISSSQTGPCVLLPSGSQCTVQTCSANFGRPEDVASPRGLMREGVARINELPNPDHHVQVQRKVETR